MANSNIPDNVLHNILVRLPSKPLLQFTCVSKHWNNLISEPYFMNSRSGRMIILSEFFPIYRHENDKHVTVVGTFNGIVLLVKNLFHISRRIRSTTHMILYNPLTRVSKKVQDPPYLFSIDASSYAFGFGHGATPDDLKIVRIEVHESHRDGDWGTYHVFDLKKSVWSNPQKFTPTYNFYNDVAGLFLNGYLYWVASKKTDKVILALNVKEMVFSKIELPHGCDYMTNVTLGSLKGCLCMMSRDCNNFNVWMMKEQEGVENSWSKQCSFKFGLEGGVGAYNLMMPYCIYILDQGRFLMMDNYGQLCIYDTSKDSCNKLIGLEAGDIYSRVYGIEYVESLVSPSDMCVA